MALLFVSCSKSRTDNVNICTNMKDAVFAEFCRTHFDADKDGVVSPEEAAAVKEIKCGGLGIESLEGIEEFPNVEVLDVSNNDLVYLDLSQNTNLRRLYCQSNKLISLVLPSSLTRIDCQDNKLSAVDLSFTKWDSINYVSDPSNPLEIFRLKEYFYQKNDVVVYVNKTQQKEIPEEQKDFGTHKTTFAVK